MVMRFLLIALAVISQLGIKGLAAQESTTAPAPAPAKGVEWTTIEDLKPDARATNRPIKQKWAVVVGLGKFKEKRLDYGMNMDKAATAFYDYAIDPQCGRFQKDHVRLLLNNESTSQNIMSTLGKPWLGSLAGPDDLVVVFISTLGFPTTDGGSYLCAYDCALDNVYGTCMSIQNLMSTLKQNVKADRILLVLQACYSGNAELDAGAKSLMKSYNLDIDKVNLGKGYIILSSSRPDQMTWGDTFSNDLVQALKENNGMVPLKDAFEKARIKTEQDTTSLGGNKKQTPVMKSDWQGKDLVLGIPPVVAVSNIPSGVLNYLSAESHYLKANRAVASGNLDEAKSEYELAISTDPEYADAFSDYGTLYSLKGDWSKAAEQYQKAIAIRPDDSLFHANYARTLAKLGQPDQCLSELEKAYKLNPKDRVVLQALSDLYVHQRNISGASDLMRQAVTLYPGSASLHDRLSYILAQAGDFDSAVGQAQEAVKLDPALTSAHLNLGASLLLKGDTDKALSAYKEACQLSPQNADVHYCLSKVLEKTGDIEGSRSELEKFLKLCSPDDPRVAKETAHLSELAPR
jgi:tetratricopeptide (TPR) repeat protein